MNHKQNSTFVFCVCNFTTYVWLTTYSFFKSNLEYIMFKYDHFYQRTFMTFASFRFDRGSSCMVYLLGQELLYRWTEHSADFLFLNDHWGRENGPPRLHPGGGFFYNLKKFTSRPI